MPVPRITHIVNPVDAGPTSDLRRAQPITVASMLHAKQYAAPRVAVQHVQVAHPSDASAMIDGFDRAPLLTRSVADLLGGADARPLPLLRDILAHAAEVAEGEIVVYSNIDIAVQPYFYDFVAELVSAADASTGFVINRRTIPEEACRDATADDLPSLFAHAGEPHPGYDCFVLPRRALDRIDVADVCLGARAVGLAMVVGMCRVLKAVNVLDDRHATFHLGDDRVWTRPEHDVYTQHNVQSVTHLWERLSVDDPELVDRLPGWSRDAIVRLHREATDPRSKGIRAKIAATVRRWKRRIGG